MKRTILSTIAILCTTLLLLSASKKSDNEAVITITSEKEITFNMSQNGKTIKNLKTPYVLKFSELSGHFIFKANDENCHLKITVDKETHSLTADWNIIALIIEKKQMSCFGME